MSNGTLFDGRPITNHIMNNASLSGPASMPMKDLTSDNTSSFAMGRRSFYETSQALQVQAREKKFIGGNRDASSVVARRTAVAIGRVNSVVSFVSADSVSKKDHFTALNRVRSGGYVVPQVNLRLPHV
jgi:hypothetical protein